MRAASAILFLSVLFSLSGCRKGEDDPLISLKSRTRRLSGKWTMKSGWFYGKYYARDTYNYTYGKNWYSLEINLNRPGEVPDHYYEHEEGPFLYTLTFEKEGAFSSTKITGKDTLILAGTWNFLKGVGKYKNNEQVAIHITNYDGYYIHSGNFTDFTFYLKELRKDKLVLGSEKYNSAEPARGGFTSTIEMDETEEYVFEK